MLSDFGCNINCIDENNNNLLQVAALYSNNVVLDYLAKNSSFDIYHRNS